MILKFLEFFLLCAGARLIFTLQYQGVLRKRAKQKIQWNFQDHRAVKIMCLQDLNFLKNLAVFPAGLFCVERSALPLRQ